jgi:hypothetical protein
MVSIARALPGRLGGAKTYRIYQDLPYKHQIHKGYP